MIKQISYETLNQMRVSKGELFQDCKFTFDYALPQDWLNDFAEWCNKYHPIITYHLIASTTVWAYPKGLFYGLPVSVCSEVHNAYVTYISNDVHFTQKYVDDIKTLQ